MGINKGVAPHCHQPKKTGQLLNDKLDGHVAVPKYYLTW